MRRFLLRLLLVVTLLTLALLGGGGLWLYREVSRTASELAPQVEAMRSFRDHRPGWSFPAEVFTDWFEFSAGSPFGLSRLEAEARARNYQEVPKNSGDLSPGQFRRPSPVRLEIALRGFDFPDGTTRPAVLRVLAQSDDHLDEVEVLDESFGKGPWRLEPLRLGEWIGKENEIRFFAPLSTIPKHVQDAILSSEDARFRDHPGVDPIGILRALRRNAQEQETVEGASTLTQQLTRTLFLNREKSYRRKWAEAVRALALERLLSKDQILEMYLNSVYLGQRQGRSIGGVSAGARAFFAKDLNYLDVSEAAVLAAVIPAPNAYSPWKAQDLVTEQRNRVLERMVVAGWLSAEEARQAQQEPLKLADPDPKETRWPLHEAWARRFLDEQMKGGAASLGLRVFTSLDPALQLLAEAAVVTEVSGFEASWGPSRKDPLQGAAFGLDPQSGLALFAVPGRNLPGDQFHRAVQARRQPGSAIKPIAYAAAFADRDETGKRLFTPATTISDEPSTFDTPEGPWRPRNAEGFYHPWISLAKAFGKSLNVATTHMVVKTGPQKVADLAAKVGIRSPLRVVPSIGLGTSEVTLSELTGALASVALGGIRIPVSPVRLAVDPAGVIAWQAPPPKERVLDEVSSAMVMTLMRNSYEKGTGFMAHSQLGHGREVAGKTGTSQQGRDLWFVGVTPRLAIGFWLGHDHGRPMRQTASDTIAPAWGRLARPLFRGLPHLPLPLPDPVEMVGIDPYSGCKGGSWMVAMPKGEPWPPCRPLTWEIPEKSEDETSEGLEEGEPGAPDESGTEETTAPTAPGATGPVEGTSNGAP